MSDLLSSSSLLMAVIAMLFSLWYGEIILLIHTKGAKHTADNVDLIKNINATLCGKIFILFLLSGAVSAIFIPETITIVVETLNALCAGTAKYNAVKAAFTLVTLICSGLTISILVLGIKMKRKVKLLSKK